MQIRPTVSNSVSVGELPEGIQSHIPAMGSALDCLLALGSSVESAAQFSADLLVGAGSILSVKAELDELRFRCNQQDDLTTDIDYFLSCKHPRNCRPVVLILRNKSRAAAAGPAPRGLLFMARHGSLRGWRFGWRRSVDCTSGGAGDISQACNR